MPYTFPSGQPIRTGPNGELLGGTYTPPGQEETPAAVEGDPEKAKAVANALGFPGVADMIDQAANGQNPLSGNVEILRLGETVPGIASAMGNASAGNILGTAAAAAKDAASGAVNNIMMDFVGDPGGIASSFLGGIGRYGSMTNELEQFASMNCIFGLGALSPRELNFPDRTYRRSGVAYGQRILKSGMTPMGKPRTFAEKSYGIDTGYYIDDVQIDTVIAPNPRSRQTNFHNLRFKVYEPYSMGMFLQTLQLVAKNAGYNNYLESPYLLTLEFLGWDDEGNPVSPSRPIRRLFPVKLVEVLFDVDTEGSRYDILCSVFNDDAFLDANQSLPVDITISGETLQEICQTGLNSLATNLNTHYLNQRKESREKTEVDEWIIAFPNQRSNAMTETLMAAQSAVSTATSGELQYHEFDDEAINAAFETIDTTESGAGYQQDNSDFGARIIEQKREFVNGRLGYSVKRGSLSQAIKTHIAGADVEPNAIGSTKILTAGPLGSGRSPFGLSNFAWNQENGLLERRGTRIDPTLRTITFRQGTKIQKIIEELVLLSEYGKSVLQQLETTSRDGMVNWFKIEAQIYIVQDTAAEKVLGRMPRIYLWNVVPYRVHRSVFQMPNDSPPGYQELYKRAAREFNYMYTGKNKDVLNFEIKFDNAFYTSIQADRGNRAGSNDPSEQSNTDRPPQVELQGNQNSANVNDGRTVVSQSVNTEPVSAGATVEDPALRIARQFNEAIVNSNADLISVEIEILGDPYFITDSGVGNYNSQSTPHFNINADGSMDHQNGEVDIIINFRTPIDIDDESGGYLMDGTGLKMNDYSGLYKVNEVNNVFKGNLFTQTLYCVRRRNIQGSETRANQVVDPMVAEQQRYESRIAELEANGGTPEDIAFARADRNGDGRLQYWEVPDRDEAQRLAAGRSGQQNAPPASAPTNPNSSTPSTATPSRGPDDGTRGGQTPPAASENNTPSTTPPTQALPTTNTPSASDVYYNYGGGPR